MRLRTLTTLFVLAPLVAVAQPACPCSGVLEGYAAWVEGNYVGYAIEVRDTGHGRWVRAALRDLRGRLATQ